MAFPRSHTRGVEPVSRAMPASQPPLWPLPGLTVTGQQDASVWDPGLPPHRPWEGGSGPGFCSQRRVGDTLEKLHGAGLFIETAAVRDEQTPHLPRVPREASHRLAHGHSLICDPPWIPCSACTPQVWCVSGVWCVSSSVWCVLCVCVIVCEGELPSVQPPWVWYLVCVWCAVCVCVSVCEGELPSVQPLWVWYLVCVWCVSGVLCVCVSVCEGELPSVVQPLWVWYLVCVWCALCVCECV